VVWTGLIRIWAKTREGPCELSNEHAGSITFWKIIGCLHNWRFLKKGQGSWSHLSARVLILKNGLNGLEQQFTSTEQKLRVRK
jgi:hypothetical protein